MSHNYTVEWWRWWRRHPLPIIKWDDDEDENDDVPAQDKAIKKLEEGEEVVHSLRYKEEEETRLVLS